MTGEKFHRHLRCELALRESQLGGLHSLHFLLTHQTGLPVLWRRVGPAELEWKLNHGKSDCLIRREWCGWSRPRQKMLGQMETRLHTWIRIRRCCSLLTEQTAAAREPLAAHGIPRILMQERVPQGDQGPQQVRERDWGTHKCRRNLVLGKEVWAVAVVWQRRYLYNTHLVSILCASRQAHNSKTAGSQAAMQDSLFPCPMACKSFHSKILPFK